MFKLIVKLAIIAAIGHAGVKIVPVFWQYAQFKDRLQETARYGGKRTNEWLVDKSMKIAKELEVPIEGPVTVQRTADFLIIDARYTGQLEYLPKQFYPWAFNIHLEEVPQRYDAYMP
jgi:hypothetical protein